MQSQTKKRFGRIRNKQKMIETLSVFQWSILALAALCIGMPKTGVQGIMLV